MKYATVRVVDSGGRPQSNAKVSVYVHQFAAEGMKDAQYTNSDGETDFKLDIDDGAQISIYVNGSEKVGRGSVRSEYKVTI